MAIATIKSTYSLDPETVRTLSLMAKRWRVSKSEALRRAIRAAAATLPDEPSVDALDALQASMALTREAADDWEREVALERRLAADRSDKQ